jgi:2-C-methyl-D-erythritol 4-phosphate cytidylyltransferase
VTGDSKPRRFALIPAAGASFRFGGAEPKQYALLAGTPLLARTISALNESVVLEAVFVVIARNDVWYEERIGEIPGVVPLRCGGRTRAESVRNGLVAMADRVEAQDWVLVHDVGRPCIDVATLNRLLHELEDEPIGGLLAIPFTEILKRSETGAGLRCSSTEVQTGLWCAQTPQMFRYAILNHAFRQADLETIADEAQAVEALGLKPRLVQGSLANIKITYPEDLDLAAAILAARPRR